MQDTMAEPNLVSFHSEVHHFIPLQSSLPVFPYRLLCHSYLPYRSAMAHL